MSVSSQFTESNVSQLRKRSNYYVYAMGITPESDGASFAVPVEGILATDIVMVTPLTEAGVPGNAYVIAVTIQPDTSFTLFTIDNSASATYNYVIYRESPQN